jgi:hypothetical protein
MSANGDVVINLSEPKTRTEKNALKRIFNVSKVIHDGKELQFEGPGKFAHVGPGGAAKKMANNICQTLAPKDECTIQVWMTEKLKEEKSENTGKSKKEKKPREYGYIARRYKSDKQIPLITIKAENCVDSDAKKQLKATREELIKAGTDKKDIDKQIKKTAEGLLDDEGRKKMEEAREKLRKNVPDEKRWCKDEDGNLVGFYQKFDWGVELKSLRKRKTKDGKEVIEEGSVVETVAE